jgi:aspartate/methionine/tyrosine aminotransferase
VRVVSSSSTERLAGLGRVPERVMASRSRPGGRGLPALREMVAAAYPGRTAADVLITSGASEALFALFSAVVSPGAHVIVEHPNYPSLVNIPRALGAKVVALPWLTSLTPAAADAFFTKLAAQERTLVVPGRCFDVDHRHFRLGFGSTQYEIREGLRRLSALLDSTDPQDPRS